MADIAAQLLSDLKRDFGLTNEQAAGVVGNLMYESGGFHSLQEIDPTVPGSRGGFGYAQWTGPRRTAFEKYVADKGLDAGSYDANYGYLKHELENNRYERNQFNKVRNADTAAEAARIISDNFLRPGKPNISARQNLASQALSYANSPVPPGEIPSVATQLDVRRQAPAVATQSPMLAASRANTSPSGGNTALQEGIMRAATVARNRVQPASADDRVTARNKAWIANNPATVSTVASIPTANQAAEIAIKANAPAIDAARRATLSIGSNQSYAGQERSPAPVSNIGQPPATRVVQSVPAPQRETPMQTARAEQGAQTPNRLSQVFSAAPAPSAPVSAPAPVAAAPALTQQQKLAILNTAQPDDRLPSTPMAGARALPPIAQPGTEAVATLTDTVNPQGLRTTAPATTPPQPVVSPAPQARPVQQAPVMQAAINVPARPQQPVMRAPLNILVDGSNTMRPSFQGSATGRTYTPGQMLSTVNGPVVVNDNGGFTNVETGKVSGHTEKGGMRYDPNGGPSGSGGFVRVK